MGVPFPLLFIPVHSPPPPRNELQRLATTRAIFSTNANPLRVAVEIATMGPQLFSATISLTRWLKTKEGRTDSSSNDE